MTTEQIDLGHKRTCPCGSVKYYDFYQEPETLRVISPQRTNLYVFVLFICFKL